MNRVSMKGAAVGGFAAVVSSVLLGIPFSLYILSGVNVRSLPPEELAAVTAAAVQAHPGIHTAQLLAGLLCAVLGGFVAAGVAKHDALLNGAVSSWLCVGLGVFTLALGKSTDPPGTTILLLAANPVCALLGGYLRGRRFRKVPQPA